MEEVTIIEIDLAKNVFQLHGAAADGSVFFRKKLTRQQFQRFMTAQPPCAVASLVPDHIAGRGRSRSRVTP